MIKQIIKLQEEGYVYRIGIGIQGKSHDRYQE